MLLILFAQTDTRIVAQPESGDQARPDGGAVDYAADPLPRPDSGAVDYTRDLVQRP